MTDLIGMVLRKLVELSKDGETPQSSRINSSLITPDLFYSRTRDKTKLNWFCFEYALELEKCIKEERALVSKLTSEGLNNSQIAKFCVHYAKHMKREVLAQLSGSIPHVRIRYEPIEGFFPTIGDALVDRILTAAAKAWDSQLECCEVCPTRCISEREQRATMFDDALYFS